MTRGQRIRQAREAAKLTQRELAYQIGVSQTTMHHLECDESRFSKYAETIAKVCEVNRTWLELGDEPMVVEDYSQNTTHPPLTTELSENLGIFRKKPQNLAEPVNTPPKAPLKPWAIPLLKWEDRSLIFKKAATIFHHDTRFTFIQPTSVGPQAFALTVAEQPPDSLLRNKDIVILDPDLKPKHNSLVMIVCNEETFSFAHYCMDGTLHYLKPTHAGEPIMKMNNTFFNVICVCIHFRNYI